MSAGVRLIRNGEATWNMEGAMLTRKKGPHPPSLPLPLNAVCVMSERMSRYHPCAVHPSVYHARCVANGCFGTWKSVGTRLTVKKSLFNNSLQLKLDAIFQNESWFFILNLEIEVPLGPCEVRENHISATDASNTH